jgi:uncharacterized membrane protein
MQSCNSDAANHIKDSVGILIIVIINFFIGIFTILKNRSMFFDEAFSLELANKPISYFTAQHIFSFIFLFVLYLISAFLALDWLNDKKFRKQVVLRKFSIWSKFVGVLAPFLVVICSLFMMYQYFQPKDVHPPGYYIVLKIWCGIFGWNYVSARFLSLLFGIIGLVFVYYIVSDIFDRRTAIVSVALMSFMSSYLHYFTEIRMYSMFFMFSVMSFYFLRRMLYCHGNKLPDGFLFYSALYFLSILPYPYIHWYMFFPLLMQISYGFWFYRKKFDLGLIVGASVFWIPAVLYFIKQFLRLEVMWLKPVSMRTFPSAINFFMFHSNTDLAGNLENLVGYAGVFMCLAVIFVYSFLVMEKEERGHIAFFLFYSTVPVIIGIVLSNFWNVYHHRYFLFMGWPFIVLVVHGIFSFYDSDFWILRPISYLVGILLVGSIVYHLHDYYETIPTELREMNDYLVKNGYCGEGYYLLHDSPFSSVPQQYYLRVSGCDAVNILYSELTTAELNSAGGDVIDKSLVISNLSFLDGKKVLYWNSGSNLIDGYVISKYIGLEVRLTND